MVLIVNNCCCGLSLKTGTIAIGVFTVLASLSGLSGLSFYAYNEDDKTSSKDDNMNKVTIGTSIFMVLAYLLQLIVSIILIYGAYKETSRLVKPWIIVSTLFLVMQIICYLIIVVVVFVEGAVADGIGFLIFATIATCIGAYFIIVVNSFHRQIQTISIMPTRV